MIISDHYNSIHFSLKELLDKRYKKVIINRSFNSSNFQELVHDIKNNKTIEEENKLFFIKKVLRENDYLILNIGMSEINELYHPFDIKSNHLLFEKIYQKVENAILEIKKYAKDTIFFIGYYNPTNYYDSDTDALFYDLDLKMNRLMMNNGIIYLSTYELVKGNNYKGYSYQLNNYGESKISQIINFYIS